jgi:hypothetical protein
VVGLVCCVVNRCEDVFSLEKRVIGKNLLEGSASGKQLQDVGDPHSLAADAGTPTALPLLYGDPAESLQIHASFFSKHRIRSLNPSANTIIYLQFSLTPS